MAKSAKPLKVVKRICSFPFRSRLRPINQASQLDRAAFSRRLAAHSRRTVVKSLRDKEATQLKRAETGNGFLMKCGDSTIGRAVSVIVSWFRRREARGVVWRTCCRLVVARYSLCRRAFGNDRVPAREVQFRIRVCLRECRRNAGNDQCFAQRCTHHGRRRNMDVKERSGMSGSYQAKSVADRGTVVRSAVSALVVASLAAFPAVSGAALQIEPTAATSEAVDAEDGGRQLLLSSSPVSGEDLSSIRSYRSGLSEGAAADSATPSLIGLGARDLMGAIPPPGSSTPQSEDPAPVELPPLTSTAKPVAIPFPTAVHLFVPGALVAIYATRRFRNR